MNSCPSSKVVDNRSSKQLRDVRSLILILFVAFFQFGPKAAFSQARDSVDRVRKNNLQLNFGLIHSRLIDDGYSKDLLFHGTNVKFGLGYGRETSKFILKFLVEGNLGTIKSKNENLPSDFYALEPSLESSIKVKEVLPWGKKSTLWAGLNLSSLNYFIINEPIFDNASLLSLHGLYMTFGGRLHLDEKQYLHLTYRLPAVVYVNRLLWNGGASDLTYSDQEHLLRTLTTRGSFTYFPVFDNLQVEASYTRRIGKGADFIIYYTFRYLSPTAEPPVHLYSNELLMSLKIWF